MDRVETILEMIAIAIDLVAIAILVFAALKFITNYLRFEFKRLQGLEHIEGIRNLRLGLGSYILLSLEFMIVSDIIVSAIARDVDDFLFLGLLVIIRVALSFFLGRELDQIRARK